MFRIVCGLWVLGVAILHVHSQTPQFRARADVVQLDVVVTDRDHRPVRGLTAADFTVIEGGRSQPILTFSPVDLPDIKTPSAKWMRSIGSDVTSNTLDTRRVIVIVMDDPNMPFSPGVTRLAQLTAHGIIDGLGPTDLAAVVYTYLGRNQNFTTDKRALKTAVDALRPHPGALACGVKELGCDLATLNSVSQVLQSAPPGRKLIMFISGGRAFVDPDRFAEMPSTQFDAWREVLQRLQQANIAVYAFDPNGLSTGAGLAEYAGRRLPIQAGALARVNETLRIFAEGTGGRAITDMNTPWETVPGVLAENSSYYLLGFRPEDPTEDGRYRKIQVKVNRPGVEIRARSGYFIPRPQRNPRVDDTPPTPLEETMARGLPTGDARLHVTVAPFAGPARDVADVVATIGVELPVAAAQSSAPVTRPVEVAVTAYDTEWRPKGTFRQRALVTVHPGPVEMLTAPYEIVARLPLRPGRYELRIGAESAPDTGGVFVNIDVPSFEKDAVSLSGLLIGGASDPRAMPDVRAPGLPATPTVARRFAPGDLIRAAARVYQGGRGKLAPVMVTATILGARDEITFSKPTTLTAEAFGAARAADYRIDLPLARLAPGPYALSIEAKLGKRIAKRDLAFVVTR